MQKTTRPVDAKGRVTLFADFAGCTITIERVAANEIIIRRTHPGKRKFTLRELVKGITKKNRHQEIASGPPVGTEVW